MSYKIISIPYFDKQLKRLAKKFPSLKIDLANLGETILENPFQGDKLIKNCYKIRLSISSKGKGKSGGARIITYVYVEGETVYLLSIYDKSERASITNDEIQALLKQISGK